MGGGACSLDFLVGVRARTRYSSNEGGAFSLKTTLLKSSDTIGNFGITWLKLYRLICLIFLLILIAFIADDLERGAFLRYTFWGLLLSTIYFLVSLKPFRGLDNARHSNALLIVFSMELFICVVFWSLYSDHYADLTTSQQFHTVGAHAIVQILLFGDFLVCAMDGTGEYQVNIALVSYALSLIFVVYCTAIYSYCYHNEEDFPYYIADPNKEDASGAIILGAFILQILFSLPLTMMYIMKTNLKLAMDVFIGKPTGFSPLNDEATDKTTNSKSLGANLHF